MPTLADRRIPDMKTKDTGAGTYIGNDLGYTYK